MSRDTPDELLNSYLAEVAAKLHELPKQEIEEITLELRSHVLDRLPGPLDTGRVSAILERLGEPEAIVREHLEARMRPEDQVADPPSLNRSLRHPGVLHTLGVALASALAYGFASCWLYTAIVKPFHPSQVGLWLLPDAGGDISLSLGSHGANTVGRDLLGWGILPLGLVIGGSVAAMMWRWNRRFVERWIAERRSHPHEAAHA